MHRSALSLLVAGLTLVAIIFLLSRLSESGTRSMSDACVIARSGDRSLAVTGNDLRLVGPGSGRSEAVPADQALVDTETGLVAVIGDQAVAVNGSHEQAEARRILASR